MTDERTLTTNWRQIAVLSMACILSFGLASKLEAAVQLVDSFGDYGWKSDDTRDAAGNNLVGITSTNAGKPGQVPTATDDTAIATQIQFVAGPAGSTHGGAVSVDGTSGNNGKSNISVISPTTGYGTGGSLLNQSFSATYQWYGQPNPTSRTLAFKIGVQSASWALSQAGFTAQRSGESVWDLVLVYVPATSDNAWSTESVDHDSGLWNVFRQASNGFFPVPNTTAQTLDAWNLDSTFGPALFGAGSKITSVQFGLGSSQRQSIAYVDYLQTSLLNGGGLIDFKAAGTVAAVPEASSVVVWGLLALVIGGVTWTRRKQLLA
jgi:hypothetical protein